jgi:3-oxoacyl-[acyl-carrier-protein] synthase I
VKFQILDFGVVSAFGIGVPNLRSGIFSNSILPTGMSKVNRIGRELTVGLVREELPALDDVSLEFRSRNNQLIRAALNQIVHTVEKVLSRFERDRVGVVVGTSTSGIGESESAVAAYSRRERIPSTYSYEQQELGNSCEFVAHTFRLNGPRVTISTACSSSAKAFASAARWLQAGIVDAVIVGGSDSLCDLTLAGFTSLESISTERCNPMSQNRNGINIGEAAAFFVLSRDGEFNALNETITLAGWGESSDAFHLSSPDPSGVGAMTCMQLALKRAAIEADKIGYVNLHGTATPLNDSMESLAVSSVFGLNVPCSSTKPLTGHTLGAAGALEAAISVLTLTHDGTLPPHWYDGETDPALPELHLVKPGERLSRAPITVLSNSFAFGGSNASLIFSRNT